MTRFLPACLATLALLGAAPAAATTLHPPPLLAQAGDIGPAGAAAAARAATGGRVLGVRAQSAGGRTVYRVKVLLPGGRVRTVTVDGASGRVG